MKQGDILKDMRKEKWDEPLLRAVQVYVVFLLENARYSYKNGGEVIRLYLKHIDRKTKRIRTVSYHTAIMRVS